MECNKNICMRRSCYHNINYKGRTYLKLFMDHSNGNVM